MFDRTLLRWPTCTAAANPTATARADSSPVTSLATTPQGYGAQGGGHDQQRGQEERHSTTLTSSAAVFLVSAVHAVGVSITAPAHGDAVPVLALELVELAAGCAVFLQRKGRGQRSAGTAPTVAGSCPVAAARSRPSDAGSPGTGAASQCEGDQWQIRGMWPRSHMQAGRWGCRQRAPPPSTVPHRSHPRSRGPRRTSTCLRCSGHWHTRTHSPSRAEVLGTDRRGETPEHGLRGWQGTLADCRGGNRTIGKLFGAMALGRGWVRSRRAEPRPLPSSSPGLPAGNGVHGGNATATQTWLWQLPAVPGPHTIPPRALLQEGTQRSPGQAWQSPHACVATLQGGGDRAPRWASSWHRADLQDHGTVWCPARDGSWDLSPPQWCRTCQGKHPSWLGEQKPIGVDLGAGGVQAE